jgi:hypothetical protein
MWSPHQNIASFAAAHIAHAWVPSYFKLAFGMRINHILHGIKSLFWSALNHLSLSPLSSQKFGIYMWLLFERNQLKKDQVRIWE